MQPKYLQLYLRLVCQLFVMHMKLVFTVVGLVSLHETPSVYIYDLTLATVIASKQVKSTYSLSKTFGDLISPRPLFLREPGNESGFFLSPGRRR